MAKKFSKDNPVQVLNIGTKILVKDVMDQYLRSLGEVKTYYASKLSVAIESFFDHRQKVIFCEPSFPEGGVLDFLEAIGGLDTFGDRYFVLAVESTSEELISLALEKGIDELLVKPFSTENVSEIMDRYLQKGGLCAFEWVKDLRAAKSAYFEKRFQEADELFGAVAKKYWGDPGVLLDVAEYFISRQQPQKSVPLLEKVLQESAETVRAMHLYGCALRRLGKYHEAVKQLSRANQFSPLNYLRQIELADAYSALAEEQIVSALKNYGENPALVLRRAQHQLLRRDYGAILTYLDAKQSYLSESGRKEAEAYINLAKRFGGIR